MDSFGSGTLVLTDDIQFVAQSGFTVTSFSYVGISSDYVGGDVFGIGGSLTGPDMEFSGSVLGSKPYFASFVGNPFGNAIASDMVGIDFRDGDSPTLSTGDVITISSGVYTVTLGQGDLAVTLTDDVLVLTDENGDAYDVALVPEPSSALLCATAFAAFCLTSRRRRP